MIYVIGSGPAGVSVAASLLQQGLQVTMLDAGLTLDPDRQATVDRLRTTAADAWHSADLTQIKGGMTATSSGVPLKYVYGSDFPYREAPTFFPLEQHNVDTAMSLARGGLSTVWGSSILPYHDRDLGAWPITTRDLAPHYEAVLRFMPVSAAQDDLATVFPLHTDTVASVTPSEQARSLLADLTHGRDTLQARKMVFGRSRVAIDPRANNGTFGCAQCGLCMYGCPYGLIYSSATTLESLLASPQFTYIPGVVVERVEERAARVTIHGKQLHDRSRLTFTGNRVYLACGPLSTSRILMTSLELYDTPVPLLDSQYFLVPLIRYRGVADVSSERLHTLAQVFVEILDETVAQQTVHLQLYTYNDLYDATLRSMFGKGYDMLRKSFAQLLNRMLVVQGYLHSDVSQQIVMTLRRPQSHDDSPKPLRLTNVTMGNATDTVLKQVMQRLWTSRDVFRAVPLTPMLNKAAAGRGFHSGGSFPMTTTPSTTLHSDVLGRPAGLQRTHCVDSTVFPSIPATTITFTVMANAHRIGASYHET